MTGLIPQLTLTPYSGPVFIYPEDPTVRDYGGVSAGAGNRPMETIHSYLGTGGSNGDARAAFGILGGVSTYKWQWVPPNDAAGQPDLTNFPAPPLFVLGKGYSVLSSTLVSSPNVFGVTISGSAGSGIGSAPPLTINSSPDYQERTDYAILTPILESGQTYKLELSPHLSYDAKGVFGDYEVQAGGQTQNWAGVSDKLFQITLAAPNPLTNPLLGDGTNQFVYDDYEPVGLLVLPASADVFHGATADTTWLKTHVTFPVTPAIAHVVPYTITASDSTVSVTTAGHFPDPDTDVSYPAASYIFKGLPAANSDFGNHAVTLTVDGNAAQVAHCQLFYTGLARNWTSDGSNIDVRNFYHYYNPLYPNGAFETNYDPAQVKGQFLAYTNPYPNATGEYSIYIEEGTGGGDLSVPIFDINPTADPNLGRKLVQRVGTLRIKGIHRYIWIAAHERGHQRIFKMGGIYTTAVQNASGNYVSPTTLPDGDHVLDAWESTHHLNPNVSDTANAYGSIQHPESNEPGDDEVLADVQALQPLMDNKDLWKQDWANFGVQYSGGTKLDWIAKPVATPAVFYWKFRPIIVGAPASGSGIQPFQVGDTVGPFGDGTYPIQTLKDLTDQYPSLLTDLPPNE